MLQFLVHSFLLFSVCLGARRRRRLRSRARHLAAASAPCLRPMQSVGCEDAPNTLETVAAVSADRLSPINRNGRRQRRRRSGGAERRTWNWTFETGGAVACRRVAEDFALPATAASSSLRFTAPPAFSVAGPQVWNCLPLEITSAPSLATFHTRLKTCLITESSPDIRLI